MWIGGDRRPPHEDDDMFARSKLLPLVQVGDDELA
jgi:hypothetical protein